MNQTPESATILLADDDADDRMLVRDALADCGITDQLRFVEDGDALLAYLHRSGPYAAPGQAPTPSVILLDLNMPKKDGREALYEIKLDPELAKIPVVVLTTSRSPEDMRHSYALGANAVVVKPVTFDGLVNLMQMLVAAWLNTSSRPDIAGEEQA